MTLKNYTHTMVFYSIEVPVLRNVKPLLKVLKDPSIYALIAFNIFFIYKYKDDPGKYTTIIWLYWCQSVLIGLFKFFKYVPLKK